MADTAFSKVEDAFAETLQGELELSGVKVVTERSLADAGDDDDGAQRIVIYSVRLDHDMADENNVTLHTHTLEFEVCTRAPGIGLGRENLSLIAQIIAILAPDRTLGGMLLDWQEIDTATPGANGKDVSSASLQVRAQYFTSRTDWTIILGQGGLTF